MTNNLEQIALNFDYDRNYFYVMRRATPLKFNYINNLVKGDFNKAFIKYYQDMDEIKFKLQDIYYELSELRAIHKFSTYIYERGLYKHPNNFSTSVTKIIFSSRNGFSTHSTYILYEKILNIFDDFIKDTKLT